MGASPTRMTCTIDPHDLASATAWAVKRVSKDSLQPMLAGMLLEVGEEFRATGFDGDVSTTATCPVTLDATPGAVVVSGRKLAELVKTFPKKPVVIEEEATLLRLACGSVKVALPKMTVEDYPTVTAAAAPFGTLDAPALREAIERVVAAADQRGTGGLPALTGVHLSFAAGELRLVASDKFRVAKARMAWDGPDEEGVALVPWAVLADVAHALDGPGTVTVGLADGLISLEGPGRVTVARLLGVGTFPAGLPKLKMAVSETPTTVAVAEMRVAIRRAEMALDPKVHTIDLAFTPDSVTVSGDGRGLAAVSSEVDCKHYTAPAVLAVNYRYLDDALAACGTEVAELTLPVDARKPILITAPGVEGFGHIIMPIRKPGGVA